MIRATLLFGLLAACQSNVTASASPPCGGACTATQQCNEATLVCEEKPCTDWSCSWPFACDATTKKCTRIPCDNACLVGQWCDDASTPGVCRANSAPTAWGVNGDGKVQRVYSLGLSDKGHSCDLVDSSGQIGATDGVGDNIFSNWRVLIGSNLSDAVKKGEIVWLLENTAWPQDGTPFTVRLLHGQPPVGQTVVELAAGQTLTVDAESYDQPLCSPTNCPAVTEFADTTLVGGHLTGTAHTLSLPVKLRLLGEIPLTYRVSGVRLSADASSVDAWESAVGRLCGYVTDQDFAAAVDALHPASAQPYGREGLKKLLVAFGKSDIDTDGDGVPDARSISLDFETYGAQISGVWQ